MLQYKMSQIGGRSQALKIYCKINCYSFCVELENVEESADVVERNIAAFHQTDGCAAECVELQDLEQPPGEFSRLMDDDDATEPARPSTWRQIKALMKIRFLSERRMPTIWLVRIILPVAIVLISALRWVIPEGLSTFSRFELKPGYYVNDSHDVQSAVNPALALLSTSPAGLYFVC